MISVEYFKLHRHKTIFYNCPACHSTLTETKMIWDITRSCIKCTFVAEYKDTDELKIRRVLKSGIIRWNAAEHKFATSCLIEIRKNLTEVAANHKWPPKQHIPNQIINLPILPFNITQSKLESILLLV